MPPSHPASEAALMGVISVSLTGILVPEREADHRAASR